MTETSKEYSVGDWLIYPKHGLGKAIDYETKTILKEKVKILDVYFEKEIITIIITKSTERRLSDQGQSHEQSHLEEKLPWLN